MDSDLVAGRAAPPVGAASRSRCASLSRRSAKRVRAWSSGEAPKAARPASGDDAGEARRPSRAGVHSGDSGDCGESNDESRSSSTTLRAAGPYDEAAPNAGGAGGWSRLWRAGPRTSWSTSTGVATACVPSGSVTRTASAPTSTARRSDAGWPRGMAGSRRPLGRGVVSMTTVDGGSTGAGRTGVASGSGPSAAPPPARRAWAPWASGPASPPAAAAPPGTLRMGGGERGEERKRGGRKKFARAPPVGEINRSAAIGDASRPWVMATAAG